MSNTTDHGDPTASGAGARISAFVDIMWKRQGPAQRVALLIVVAYIGAAFLAPALFGDAARRTAVEDALMPPSWEHPFGTDAEGRDVLVRCGVGAAISILCAAVAVVVGAGVGLSVALMSGVGPRWLDSILMRIIDGLLSFPNLIFALAIAVALGAGLVPAVIGISVALMPIFARTLRTEAVRSREELFVVAGVALGVGALRRARKYVLPYLSTTLLVQVAANVGNAVLILAGLSFVGAGVQPPTPEWGSMITDGMEFTLTGQWWVAVAPGVCLALLVVALNIVADGMRRASARRVGDTTGSAAR